MTRMVLSIYTVHALQWLLIMVDPFKGHGHDDRLRIFGSQVALRTMYMYFRPRLLQLRTRASMRKHRDRGPSRNVR